jgi:ATP-dependent DNA helicase RecG
LAETFYRAGMVESYGRGIERIMECYKDTDTTPPIFDATQTMFRVTLTSMINPDRSTMDPMPTVINERLSDDENKVLNSIIKGSISYSEICNDTGLGRSTVAKLISSLVEKGIISRIGSTKKGFWALNEDNWNINRKSN